MSRVTLQGITWDHPRGFDPLYAASLEYERNFGVRIEWTRRSLKEFGDQSLEQLAKHSDLLIVDHPHSGVAERQGYLLPLNEHLSAASLELLISQSAGPCFSSYHFGAKQWALPIDAAFQSASYRPDLLNLPIPSDWEDVFSLARKLSGAGKFVGMALCPTDAMCSFLSLGAVFGFPISADQDYLIELNAGLRILELMRRMRDNFHPMSLQWNPIDMYERMATADQVVYAPLAFNYSNYARTGFRQHVLNFSNAPGSVAVLGGAGIAVSASTRFVKASCDFAFWICSAEVQKGIYVRHQGQPANVLAWADKGTNKLTHDFFSSCRATLDNAFVRPRYYGWPAFQEWLGETIHRFLLHDDGPEAVLSLINERYAASKRV